MIFLLFLAFPTWRTLFSVLLSSLPSRKADIVGLDLANTQTQHFYIALPLQKDNFSALDKIGSLVTTFSINIFNTNGTVKSFLFASFIFLSEIIIAVVILITGPFYQPKLDIILIKIKELQAAKAEWMK